MKALWLAACFLAVLAMGCVTTQEKTKGTVWKAHNEPPQPPVTPAQVKPENAHKLSDALWDEIVKQFPDKFHAVATTTAR